MGELPVPQHLLRWHRHHKEPRGAQCQLRLLEQVMDWGLTQQFPQLKFVVCESKVGLQAAPGAGSHPGSGLFHVLSGTETKTTTPLCFVSIETGSHCGARTSLALRNPLAFAPTSARTTGVYHHAWLT